MYIKYEDAKLLEVQTFHDWLDHLDPDEVDHLCALVDKTDADAMADLADHFVQILAIETPGECYTDEAAEELFAGFTTILGLYKSMCDGHMQCLRARITLVDDRSTFRMTTAGTAHVNRDLLLQPGAS